MTGLINITDVSSPHICFHPSSLHCKQFHRCTPTLSYVIAIISAATENKDSKRCNGIFNDVQFQSHLLQWTFHYLLICVQSIAPSCVSLWWCQLRAISQHTAHLVYSPKHLAAISQRNRQWPCLSPQTRDHTTVHTNTCHSWNKFKVTYDNRQRQFTAK